MIVKFSISRIFLYKSQKSSTKEDLPVNLWINFLQVKLTYSHLPVNLWINFLKVEFDLFTGYEPKFHYSEFGLSKKLKASKSCTPVR